LSAYVSGLLEDTYRKRHSQRIAFDEQPPLQTPTIFFDNLKKEGYQERMRSDPTAE
jgi:hypothetical protein